MDQKREIARLQDALQAKEHEINEYKTAAMGFNRMISNLEADTRRLRQIHDLVIVDGAVFKPSEIRFVSASGATADDGSVVGWVVMEIAKNTCCVRTHPETAKAIIEAMKPFQHREHIPITTRVAGQPDAA